MIRGREKLLTIIYVILDIMTIQLSFFIAWYSRFYILESNDSNILPFKDYFFWNLIYVLIFVSMALFTGLYASKRRKRFIVEVVKILQSNVVATFLLLSILFIVRTIDISRLFLVIYVTINFLLIVVYRYIVKKSMMVIRKKGYNKQFILVLGAGNLGKMFLETLNKYPEYGFEVLGFLDDNKNTFYKSDNIEKEILGSLNLLPTILESTVIDEVIVALPLSAHNKYIEIIKACEKAGVRVSIIPDYYDVLPANPHFERFGELPVIKVRDIPLDDIMNRILKRTFDFMFSLVALILTSPLLITIAVIIKVTSPGPILFKQERVGLNRKTFKMYKFRSMKNLPEELSDTQWTVENDPRRTKFGTFLRKTSLDELPQFLNVLFGDMSVVGPRPERPYFVEKFKEEIPKYMVKHQVRPGITGWAQISGLRGDTSIEERIKYDLHYIENWNILLDFKIIFKTVINGFINKNAY